MKPEPGRLLVRYGLGLALGCLAGWLWYAQVGCESGTCPITSRPLPSALYGGLLGVLAAGLVPRRRRNTPD